MGFGWQMFSMGVRGAAATPTSLAPPAHPIAHPIVPTAIAANTRKPQFSHYPMSRAGGRGSAAVAMSPSQGRFAKMLYFTFREALL